MRFIARITQHRHNDTTQTYQATRFVHAATRKDALHEVARTTPRLVDIHTVSGAPESEVEKAARLQREHNAPMPPCC